MKTKMNTNINKIVIKIGTSSLTYPNGKLNLRQIKNLSEVCTNLRNSNKQVIIVSSGAIGAGIGKLGLSSKPQQLEMKQAMAAIGQAFLIQLYQKYFSEYGQICAQVLLTEEVMKNEIQRDNVIRTLSKLHELGVIPIINENDTVSIDEIEGTLFSDNDHLSAMVSVLTGADLLVLMSDIDGLYKKENGLLSNSIIKYVSKIDEDIYSCVSNDKSKLGSGGMLSKLDSIKYVMEHDIDAVICNSNNMDIIYDILDGQKNGKYTYFKKEVS